MNYSQIMSPLSPFASKSGGSCPSPYGSADHVSNQICLTTITDRQYHYDLSDQSAENFNRLSMVHERYRRQTDGRAVIASERSLKTA